ncbi:MAG: hypothetical protein NTV26_06000 [Caldiserica bacterium]|nr:hypothetical protein [Caldisericota bacterium]
MEVAYRTDEQRFLEENSSVRNEISRTVVVCGIDDHVIGAEECIGVVRIQPARIRLDTYLRVQRHQPFFRNKSLGLTDVSRDVEDLSVQVGQADCVSVHNSYCGHPGGGKAQKDGGAESSGSHYQNRGFCQFLLSQKANLLHPHLTLVATIGGDSAR